jgi:hypothetical protein
MMDGCTGGDPVEDFLIGGAGDDLAAFCDGGYGRRNKTDFFVLLLLDCLLLWIALVFVISCTEFL